MRVAIAFTALLAVAATQRGGCGPSPEPAPASPCAGLACGAECTIEPACRSSTPPCLAPSFLGHCDAAGACVPAAVTCGPSPCDGKRCGDPCNPCGDAHPCPTFAATACDRNGACVLLTPGLCYEPCAGKACGDPCSICPPGAGDCAAILCITSCDAAGRCTCTGGGAACTK